MIDSCFVLKEKIEYFKSIQKNAMFCTNRYFVFITIINICISRVELQTWTGSFAWNSQCNSNYCCCYAGELTVTRSGSNLVFTSGAKGCGSSKTSSMFPNPNSYSFTTQGIRGSTITYSLSPDANTLTVQNTQYGQCGGVASRTSAADYRFPSIISLGTILGCLWICSAFLCV